jgi:hypothetical protein
MLGFETSRHTRRWISSGIHDVLAVMMLGVVEQCLNSWLGETPCACVERLFLTPDDSLGIGVVVKIPLQ